MSVNPNQPYIDFLTQEVGEYTAKISQCDDLASALNGNVSALQDQITQFNTQKNAVLSDKVSHQGNIVLLNNLIALLNE